MLAGCAGCGSGVSGRASEEVPLKPPSSPSVGLAEKIVQSLDKKAMLDSVDTLLQVIDCVLWENLDLLLQHNRPRIDGFIRHEVDHYAGMLDLALLEGLVGALDGMRAGKHPWQSRV